MEAPLLLTATWKYLKNKQLNRQPTSIRSGNVAALITFKSFTILNRRHVDCFPHEFQQSITHWEDRLPRHVSLQRTRRAPYHQCLGVFTWYQGDPPTGASSLGILALWYHRKNVMLGRLTPAPVHSGCCTGAKTSFRRQISQRHHANEERPPAPVWNRPPGGRVGWNG